MDKLIKSDQSHEQLKMLVDTLVDRQVKKGERTGSFNAEANPSFYYDYTPPLALIAATQDSKTIEWDQEIYLNSVKDWLKHSYENQKIDGTVRPFGVAEGNIANAEAVAGVVWVASWYKDAIKDRSDKAELSVISDKDPAALGIMVKQSLTALETAQAAREDGLIDSAESWPFAYYTANAHIHAALASTMQTYGKDSEIYTRAKAIDDKLAAGLKEFAMAGEKDGHIPFQKGHDATNFVQSPGHEVIVDAYSTVLHGKNSYTQALKTKFEQAMGDPAAKAEFLQTQTVPSSVPMALAAAGYTSATINGKNTPLTQIMEDQIAALQNGAKTDYLHKIAIAALVGYKGSAWMPPLEPAVAPKLEVIIEKLPVDMDDAFKKAMDEFINGATDKPAATAPDGDASFNQALDEFIKQAAKNVPVTELPADPFAPAVKSPPSSSKKIKLR